MPPVRGPHPRVPTLMLIALCMSMAIQAEVNTAASPLAQPRSMQQVGLPLAATRAAIPAADLPTPEKVALGQPAAIADALSKLLVVGAYHLRMSRRAATRFQGI